MSLMSSLKGGISNLVSSLEDCISTLVSYLDWGCDHLFDFFFFIATFQWFLKPPPVRLNGAGLESTIIQEGFHSAAGYVEHCRDFSMQAALLSIMKGTDKVGTPSFLEEQT